MINFEIYKQDIQVIQNLVRAELFDSAIIFNQILYENLFNEYENSEDPYSKSILADTMNRCINIEQILIMNDLVKL